VYEYLEGNQFISGLDFVNNEFSSLPELYDTMVETSIEGATNIEDFRSKLAMDIVLTHGVKCVYTLTNAQNHSGLLSNYKPESTDYSAHLKQYHKSELPNAIGGCYLKINEVLLDKFSEDLLGASLHEILNDYYVEIYPLALAEMKALLSGERTDATKPTREVPPSTAFSGMANAGMNLESKEYEDMLKKLVYEGDVGKVPFVKLMVQIPSSDPNTKPKNAQVGWVCTDKNYPFWVFASLDELNLGPDVKGGALYSESVSTSVMSFLLKELGYDVPVMKAFRTVSETTLPKILTRKAEVLSTQ
jgi:hypothetical protein